MLAPVIAHLLPETLRQYNLGFVRETGIVPPSLVMRARAALLGTDDGKKAEAARLVDALASLDPGVWILFGEAARVVRSNSSPRGVLSPLGPPSWWLRTRSSRRHRSVSRCRAGQGCPKGTPETRLGHGTRRTAQGLVGSLSGIPKELAIKGFSRDRAWLAIFDRIDRGDIPDDANEYWTVRYLEEGPEGRAAIRRAFGPDFGKPPEQRSFYRFSNEMTEFGERTFPTNPEFKGDFFTDVVPYELGRLGGIILAGAAGATVGIPPIVTAGAIGFAQGGVDEYEQAIARGASIEEALTASGYASLIGTTEGLPIARLFDRIDKATRGSIKGAVANAIKQGTEEAAQELFQTVTTNAITAGIYDPERDLFVGAEEGAEVGFTVGSILGFIGTLAVGRRRRGGQGPAQVPTGPMPETTLSETAPTEPLAPDGPTPETTLSETAPTAPEGPPAATRPDTERAVSDARKTPLAIRVMTESENFAAAREAIARVLETGESVRGAVVRSDVGEITIDRGKRGARKRKYENGWGLSHIIVRRNLEGIDGERFVREVLPEILAWGRLHRLSRSPNARRAEIIYGPHRALLNLYRFGTRETWVLTAYRRWDK